jgi:uncharacterized LabA/DUF88 family protein
MKKRVIAFVDGFNLYHALDVSVEHGRNADGTKKYYKPYARYKWLDLQKICKCFLTKNEELSAVYYFTALTTWSEEKMMRHRLYIRALESIGIHTVYGAFKEKDVFCTHCKHMFVKREEKRTDVNIAIHVQGLAQKDMYDRALLLTGDSDLIPAVEWVRTHYPEKRISVIVPIGRPVTQHLRAVANDHGKIKESHLQASLLPAVIYLQGGKDIVSPFAS